MKKNSKIAYVAPEQCKLLPKDWDWFEPIK